MRQNAMLLCAQGLRFTVLFHSDGSTEDVDVNGEHMWRMVADNAARGSAAKH